MPHLCPSLYLVYRGHFAQVFGSETNELSPLDGMASDDSQLEQSVIAPDNSNTVEDIEALVLPFTTTLPTGLTLTVEEMTNLSQMTEVFTMIEQDASTDNQGFCAGEFKDVTHFLRYMSALNGKFYRIYDRESLATVAAFVVLDFNLYRGPQPAVCDTFVVVNPRYRGQRVGSLAGLLSLRVARALGYVASYWDFFADNAQARQAAKTLGFREVAVLPLGTPSPSGYGGGCSDDGGGGGREGREGREVVLCFRSLGPAPVHRPRSRL